MSDTAAQTIWEMIGTTEVLVKALNIASCTEATQVAILEKFSDYLFKRILLRVPAEHVMEVQEVIGGDGGREHGLDDLVDVIARYIPNPRTVIEEEIAQALFKFRVP